MKTAITVLQEMMMKLGVTPEYECISQSGPQHQSLFEYVCRVRGDTARGTAGSKKEAKQEAARAMLVSLAASGAPVPPEYGGGGAPVAPPPPPTPRSFVALLKELCAEYKLPAVEYELVGDTGPPHLRHFTVRATLGQHARLATATTKKMARQLAAEELYLYLRDNLKLTQDFIEEEALIRYHEKVMERYRETRTGHAARPRLAQRVADYHLGLHDTFGRGARALACEALDVTRGRGAEVALGCAAGALGTELAWAELAGGVHVVSLAPSAPPLAFAGDSREAAAAAAVAYLRRALPGAGPEPEPESGPAAAPAPAPCAGNYLPNISL